MTALVTGKSCRKTDFQAFIRILRREIGLDGFAFAMALSVGGGLALRELWAVHDSVPEQPEVLSQHTESFTSFSPSQKTFITNMISSSFGMILLQAGRRRSYRLRQELLSPIVTLPLIPPTPTPESRIRVSDTLDLTLLLLVRAADSLLQTFIRRTALVKDVGTTRASQEQGTEAATILTSRIDAFVFWASSARIMWCFFYKPERLPKSYVKWIATLANLDGRVIQTLQLLREGNWSYIKGSPANSAVLAGLSRELGYNTSWGDPTMLPAYGGIVADAAWKTLGVKNRRGVGGIPCEIVHGSIGSSLGLEGSCMANSLIRGVMAFLEAIAIYLPAHLIPVLLTRPHILLNLHRALTTLFGVVRSATFLSTFVSLYWFVVCVTRSLVLARLFPWISHDFWDGPFGCIFAGSLMCGSSIWIETGRRRGEMALYVLPRAVRACLPDALLRKRSKIARLIERIVFVISFSTLVTAAIHQPYTLRGLSRWTLSFILNGFRTNLWKEKQRDPRRLDTQHSSSKDLTTSGIDTSSSNIP
ncbi:hypothetical protein E4T56_gene2885 [Termitomyces sp. T112]|nr:hypothetical protein E4T56_gene2885 [Termitomyces sp. T112]